jgi:hypothetical protein
MQHDFMASIFDDAPVAEADRGMEIYRRNVLGNLHDALASAYPVVRRLVGEAFFREAAKRFARANPSRSGDLHEYGDGFGAFLAAYPYAAGLPCLEDVARLEWAVQESFHAADASPLDFAALARVAPERHGELRFRLHPSVRLVRSAHPILAIWEANQAGRDGTPEAVTGGQRVLVMREELAVRPRILDAGDWTILAALQAGTRLDEVADALGEAGDSLAPALARFAGTGAIAGYAAG